MTIGVIGAMQMEVDDLKAQMTDTQDRKSTRLNSSHLV